MIDWNENLFWIERKSILLTVDKKCVLNQQNLFLYMIKVIFK